MIYLVFIFLPDFGAPRFNSYLSYANHAWLWVWRATPLRDCALMWRKC